MDYKYLVLAFMIGVIVGYYLMKLSLPESEEFYKNRMIQRDLDYRDMEEKTKGLDEMNRKLDKIIRR